MRQREIVRVVRRQRDSLREIDRQRNDYNEGTGMLVMIIILMPTIFITMIMVIIFYQYS